MITELTVWIDITDYYMVITRLVTVGNMDLRHVWCYQFSLLAHVLVSITTPPCGIGRDEDDEAWLTVRIASKRDAR